MNFLSKNSRTGLTLMFIPLLIGSGRIWTQETVSPVTIHGITVEEKANGTIIRINKFGNVTPSQVTAWISETNWFYMTVWGGIIDTTIEFHFTPTGIIQDLQYENLPESVQINFSLTREIETFEIDTELSDDILATLRLPLAETLATIEKIKALEGEKLAVPPEETSPTIKTITNKIPFAMMFTGSALFITGVIEFNNSEMISGLLLLGCGYFLNNYINNSQEEN